MAIAYQVLLSGPPGVGKTTTGKALASKLHQPFFDLDESVQSKSGYSPAEILRSKGEEELRRVERGVLEELPREPAVIALGGGTLVQARSRAEARSRGLLIGLEASPEALRARLEADPTERPLLSNDHGKHGRLTELLETRASSYQAVDSCVPTDESPEIVAERIADRVLRTRFRRCRVGETETRILVGRDLSAALTGAIAHRAPSRTVVVLTDDGVPKQQIERYLAPLSRAFPLFHQPLPGGEDCKRWQTLEAVTEGALAAGAGRQSVVIGLGGGAVLDLAGFVASILGRGAPLVLVPTTVLAQVDASVGGKCAINTRSGRNLVGAFHPAEAVVVDLDFLDSLPEEEHRSGMVEVLKMGLIADAALFDRVSRTKRAELDTIDRAIELKAGIVERDPYDRSERLLLNLGHTVGHALEAASDYTLRHGEAVALGIRWIVEVSRLRAGLSAAQAVEITKGIHDFLPRVQPDAEAWSRALQHMRHDKKGDRGTVELIVVPKIGEAARQRVSWSEVEGMAVPFGGSTE